MSFRLLAAWPVFRAGGHSYHGLLMNALEMFGPFLMEGPSVLAGDLNTSTRVTSQRITHSAFVARAGQFGMVSAYHEQTGEAHGEETTATYRQGGAGGSDFHIDYCFVSRSLSAAAAISIPRSTQWLGRSDHCPIVLDIPDAAIAAAHFGIGTGLSCPPSVPA